MKRAQPLDRPHGPFCRTTRPRNSGIRHAPKQFVDRRTQHVSPDTDALARANFAPLWQTWHVHRPAFKQILCRIAMKHRSAAITTLRMKQADEAE
jgi:hypothetical protein